MELYVAINGCLVYLVSWYSKTNLRKRRTRSRIILAPNYGRPCFCHHLRVNFELCPISLDLHLPLQISWNDLEHSIIRNENTIYLHRTPLLLHASPSNQNDLSTLSLRLEKHFYFLNPVHSRVWVSRKHVASTQVSTINLQRTNWLSAALRIFCFEVDGCPCPQYSSVATNNNKAMKTIVNKCPLIMTPLTVVAE